MQFVVRRLAALIPTMFLVSVIVFSLMQLTPGDPAVAAAGPDASAEQVAEIRERLGLNASVVEQYWRWASQAVTGDLGQSILSGFGVLDSIGQRLPVTLSLAGMSILVALTIAVPAGTLAAVKAGGWVDRTVVVFASMGIALPNFALGLILVYLFAFVNPWLPATGYVEFGTDPIEWFRRLVLPAVALGMSIAAELTRHLRASLRDVLHADYIRTVRAKGMTPVKVVGKHGLKHAAIPVVTVLGLQLGNLLGGTIVVEQVFGLPGVGTLAVGAVFTRDYPVIQGAALLAAVAVLLINFLVDLSYTYFNPRIRAR